MRHLLALSLLLPLAAFAADSDAAKARWAAWEAHQALENSSLFHGLKWRAIGPIKQGGRVVDIEPVPGDPYAFYVAYASGGVWKTTNNGVSFQPLSDGLPTTISGDIAVDPSNPQVLWIGSGEPNSSRSSYGGMGVFKSSDGGASFESKGLTDADRIGRVVVDPRDGNRVFVAAAGKLYTEGGQRGVYLTEDGGTSWTQVLAGTTPMTGAIDLKLDPKNPDVVYAVLWDRSRTPWEFTEAGVGSGVHKSTDGGRSWNKLTGLPDGVGAGRMGITISDSNPNVLYVSVDNNNNLPESKWDLGDSALSAKRLAKMSKAEFLEQDPDEIESFIRGTDLPVELDAKALLAKVRSGDVTLDQLRDKLGDGNAALFTTDIHGLEIYRSDDAGGSFRRTHAEPLRGVTFTYGYYFGEIRVDPIDENKIFVLGVPVVTSRDGGASFDGLNNPEVHVDHHAWWIDPVNPNRILNGNDGGVDISYDGGKTWASLDRQPVGQIYALNYDMAEPYNVYVGMQDNGTWKGPSTARWQSIDAWSELNGGDGMQIEIDPRDNTTHYTGYQFGFYTRADGQEIRPRAPLNEPNLRFNWQTPILLSSFNADVLYMGANKLYRSMDQGETWAALSGDLTTDKRRGDVPYGTITTIDESPKRFGLLWAGTDDGHVHVTRDGGLNWRDVSGELPDRWVSRVEASTVVEGRAYVTLSGYRLDEITPYVYVTEDFGASWRSLRANLPNETLNVIREDPENADVLYVGSQRGVYVSRNRGERWESLPSGLPNVTVHDLKIHPRERELIIGTHGRSAWILDALPIQDLTPAIEAKALHLFPVRETKASRGWRSARIEWFDFPAYRPRLDVPFWASSDGRATVEVLDANGSVVSRREIAVQRGINRWRHDLKVNQDLALAAERVSLSKLNADQRRNAKTRPYSEAVRLGQQLFIQPGDYQIRIRQGASSAQAKWTVSAPKAYESRAPKTFKVRGKGE